MPIAARVVALAGGAIMWISLVTRAGELHIPVRPQGDVAVAYLVMGLVTGAVVARLVRSTLRSALPLALAAAVLGHLVWALARLPLPAASGAYATYAVLGQQLLLATASAVVARNVLSERRRAIAEVWWTSATIIGLTAVEAALRDRPVAALALASGAFAGLVVWPRVATRLRGPGRWPGWPFSVALMVLVALVLRAAAGVRLIDQLGPEFPSANGLFSPDGKALDAAGAALAAGTLTADPGGQLPRGYWGFLGLAYRAIGHHYLPISLIQAAVGASVVVSTFVAFRRLSGAPPALAAAALVAISGTLVFTSAVIGTEALAAAALTTAFAALCVAVPTERAGSVRVGYLAASGAAFGLATAVDPRAWLAALVACLALAARRDRRGSRGLRQASVLAGGWLGVLLPLAVWDLSALGRPTLLTSGAESAFAGCLRTICVGPAWRSLGFDPFMLGWTSVAALLRDPLGTAKVLVDFVPVGLAHYFIGDWVGSFDPTLLNRLSIFAQQVRIYAFFLLLLGVLVGLRSERGSWQHRVGLGVITTQALGPVLLGDPWVLDRVPSDPLLLGYVALGGASSLRWLRASGAGRR